MNKLQYMIFILLLAYTAVCCAGPLAAHTNSDSNMGNRVGGVLTKDGRTPDNTVFFDDLQRLGKFVDPDQYVLGPYDRLLISITGTETRSFDLLVLPEGNVFLPGIGAVRADGISISEFRERVLEKISNFFNDIELHCYLVSPRIFKVFVSGEVNMPGMVEISAVESVSEAIKKAGDITSKGSSRMVEVRRKGEVIKVDLMWLVI